MPQALQLFIALVIGIFLIGLLFRLVNRWVPVGLPRDLAYIGVVIAILGSFGGGWHFFGWFH